VKCDVCSVISFPTRRLYQQQSTHSDNTRASCPLVAIETHLKDKNSQRAWGRSGSGQLSARKNSGSSTGVWTRDGSKAVYFVIRVRFPEGIWDSCVRYRCVQTRSSEHPSLQRSVAKLVKSNAAAMWNWTLVPIWIGWALPLRFHIMRHGVRLTCTYCKSETERALTLWRSWDLPGRDPDMWWIGVPRNCDVQAGIGNQWNCCAGQPWPATSWRRQTAPATQGHTLPWEWTLDPCQCENSLGSNRGLRTARCCLRQGLRYTERLDALATVTIDCALHTPP
jgi:hypothetical protein